MNPYDSDAVINEVNIIDRLLVLGEQRHDTCSLLATTSYWAKMCELYASQKLSDLVFRHEALRLFQIPQLLSTLVRGKSISEEEMGVYLLELENVKGELLTRHPQGLHPDV